MFSLEIDSVVSVGRYRVWTLPTDRNPQYLLLALDEQELRSAHFQTLEIALVEIATASATPLALRIKHAP